MFRHCDSAVAAEAPADAALPNALSVDLFGSELVSDGGAESESSMSRVNIEGSERTDLARNRNRELPNGFASRAHEAFELVKIERRACIERSMSLAFDTWCSLLV